MEEKPLMNSENPESTYNEDEASGASECSSLYKTYKRRFLILGMFSFLMALQLLVWNTWGPINQSAIASFENWNSGTIAMILSWSNIMFGIFMLPMLYVVNTYGLRTATLLCCFIITFGTTMRILDVDSLTFKILCTICSGAVGIIATISQASPPLISAKWFPSHERTTATAACLSFAHLGIVASFLQPLIVIAPGPKVPVEEIREDIHWLMLYDAGLCILFFILTLIWFPSQPPTPPSATASVERFEYWISLKSLFQNGNFLLILASYSLKFGMSHSWQTVFNFSLLTFGIEQDEAKTIAIVALIFGVVMAIPFGALNDRFYGHLKISLIILNLVTLVAYLWFMLLTIQVIKYTKWQVYLSVILIAISNFGSGPLNMELGVEASYPVHEAIVGGVLASGMMFVGIVFLYLYNVLEGYTWVSYALVGTSICSVLLLLIVKEDYARSSVDEKATLSLTNTYKSTESPAEVDDLPNKSGYSEPLEELRQTQINPTYGSWNQS